MRGQGTKHCSALRNQAPDASKEIDGLRCALTVGLFWQDEWVRDQALQRAEEPPDGSKEVDSLRLKLQEAQEGLDATRASLTAAEKAAVDAEKALQRWVPPLVLYSI